MSRHVHSLARNALPAVALAFVAACNSPSGTGTQGVGGPATNGSGTAPNGSGNSGSGSSGAAAVDVTISTGNGGFTFRNRGSDWVWVSYALPSCKDVDSVYGCGNRDWAQTVSLAPAGRSGSKLSCALMEDVSSEASTYSYTVQWVAYVDTSDGNLYTPDTYPAYSQDAGTRTRVVEDAGTDHGASTCM